MKDHETSFNSRAVIFAEGGDPRLRPLTDHLPTSLVPVGGTSILDHQVRTLLRHGVTDITVVGGYRAAQVEQACRPYAAVGFRFNPHFSKTEPGLTALQACGLPGGGPNIFLRGDLIFDGDLVDRILKQAGHDLVVQEGDRPIGVYSLTPETAQEVFTRGIEALAAGKTEQEIFPFLENQLAGFPHEILEVGDSLWARVSTMEDLARALKIHKNPEDGRRTPRETGPRPKVNRSAPMAEQLGVSSKEGSPKPALAGKSASSPLARPLLKVLHN